MSNVLHFCLLVPGLVFSLCTLNVVTDSMLTKAVSAADTGELYTGAQESGFLPVAWAKEGTRKKSLSKDPAPS